MTRAAGRRSLRTGVLAALLLPALQLTPAAAQAPSQSQEPEAPIRVGVEVLLPKAPQPGDDLQLAGVLRNTGTREVRDLQVRLRKGGQLISRSELELADTEGAATERVAGTEVPLEVDLGPGESTRFDLRTSVDRLGLPGTDGVWPLALEVRGRVGGDDARTSVGLASTFLPWFGDGLPTGRTRIAFVWPVTDSPRSAPRATSTGLLLLDDDLAASLAEGGRLERLLRSARAGESNRCDPAPARPEGAPPRTTPAPACRAEPVPVAYAVDPDLAFTAVGMSAGYAVRVDEDTTRAGEGVEAAEAWVDRLREAVRAPGAGLVGLPYADVDVVALAGAGSTLRRDTGLATTIGREELEKALGLVPRTDIAVAPAGPVGTSALEDYASAGTRSLVLSEDALPPRPPRQTRTSGTRSELPVTTGPLTGLVVDETLSRLLQPPAATWQGARLAEQRWIAETAIVAAEEPDDTRTLLVAPPRGADLTSTYVAEAVRDTGRLPWLCGVALSDVAAGTEACPSGPVAPAAAYAPETRGGPLAPDDDAGLPPAQLELLAPTRREVDQLTLRVLRSSEEAADTRRRMLRAAFRAESRAWRDPEQRARGRVLSRLLGDDVADLAGRVRTLIDPRVTLTSSSGALNVNVENQLDQPVTVKVRLQSPNQARLGTSVSPAQVVPPRTSVQIRMRVEPRTSGSFPVDAQLLDASGVPFGDPAQFVLRSTRYGAVALAVTGVAAGVLLAAVGVRLLRRALRGELPRTRAEKL